jgi:Ca2+-binding EF-hand superfamily protein
MFKKIDSDNKGYFTLVNARAYYSMFKNDEELQQFFSAMDLDGNGKIHWNEFLSTMIS